MVAAKPIQKQLIEVHLLHKMEGVYPDVPISPDVDFEGLVKPDRDAEEEPFLIVLPLGEYNQISGNNRRYIEDVAINAISSAINSRRITGQLGHTSQDNRAWEFKIPALHWVGATIDENKVVWGKAYIPRTSMDLREYYRIQMKTNSKVGTSLEGWGYQEWDEENEVWNILELDVTRIDAVSPDGVGVLKAGSMPPKITSESKEIIKEAVNPGELEIEDYVSWDDNGSLIRGRVNTIWADGEVEVPYSDSPKLTATMDDPIARMDVYSPSWEDGTWINASHQAVRHFSQLNKLESLPEIKQDEKEPVFSEKETEGETKEMTDKSDNQDTDNRIAELTETHQTELGELQTQVSDTQRENRKLVTELKTIRERLGIAEDGDVVVSTQELVSERDELRKENTALLETAIEQAIGTHAKLINEALQGDDKDVKAFAETVQTMVVALITAEGIRKKADVEPTVKKIFGQENVKSMLAGLRVAVMGPNVNSPFEDEIPPNTNDMTIIIPGAGGE